MDLTPPTPNIPLLRKAVEWAEAEAAKRGTDEQCLWNQSTWAQRADCGTAYCIAGFTVMAAHPGAQLRQNEYVDDEFDLYIDGEHAFWGDQAMQLLGLTRNERYDLFEAENTIADVRRIAEQIAARIGERL